VNGEGKGVPYISGPEQWDGSVVHLNKWTTDPKRMAPDGSIFITVKGAGVGTIFPGVAGAIGRDVYAFKPREEVDRHLVRYALLHSVNEIKRRAVGDIPGISKNDILDHVIGLPSLKQQRKIAEAIDAHFTRLDAAVSALERVRANLKRYRASVLKAACEGRLVPTEAELARREGRDYEPADVLLERILEERRARWEAEELARLRAQGREPTDDRWKRRYKEPEPPDTTGLPELPEGWVWATMDQLLSEPLRNGRSVRSRSGGFPVLRLTALSNGRVNLLERKEGDWSRSEAEPFLVASGDFLIARGNGSLSLVGRGAVVDQVIDEVAFPDTIIRARLTKEVSVGYLAGVWDSQLVRSQIELRARTTAGIYKINQDDLRSVVIPLPPKREQDRIAASVESRFSVVATTEVEISRQIGRTTRLRQCILKRAFEGRLVPQDPSDEPASVLLERIRAERGSRASAGQGARGRGATVPVPR